MSIFFDVDTLSSIFQALNGTSLETACGTFTFVCAEPREDNSHLHYRDAEGTEYRWSAAPPRRRSSFSRIVAYYKEIAEDVEFEEIVEQTESICAYE